VTMADVQTSLKLEALDEQNFVKLASAVLRSERLRTLVSENVTLLDSSQVFCVSIMSHSSTADSVCNALRLAITAADDRIHMAKRLLMPADYEVIDRQLSIVEENAKHEMWRKFVVERCKTFSEDHLTHAVNLLMGAVKDGLESEDCDAHRAATGAMLHLAVNVKQFYSLDKMLVTRTQRDIIKRKSANIDAVFEEIRLLDAKLTELGCRLEKDRERMNTMLQQQSQQEAIILRNLSNMARCMTKLDDLLSRSQARFDEKMQKAREYENAVAYLDLMISVFDHRLQQRIRKCMNIVSSDRLLNTCDPSSCASIFHAL
jgi:hypothetical protein